MEKYGIENTKKVVSFAADTAEAIYSIADDGKVTRGEVLQAGGGLMFAAMTKLSGLGMLPNEIKDLSNEEVGQLIEFFAEDFDIPNEKAETLVESILDWLGKTFELGKTIVQLRGKTTVNRVKG